MQIQKIPFEATHSFSSFFLDYIKQKESLKAFYHRFPSPGNFQGQIEEKAKTFSSNTREALVNSLTAQYEGYTLTTAVKNNLESLAGENTFTITTGHQLNIFTGPLYFIYKIVTVINTCRQLKERYPQYNFVPVYWMASEDHDYDEIKSFRLNGKKFTWETHQQGAVGRFHTKDFKQLLPEIPGEIKIFRDAYSKNNTLSAAVRYYVNELFGKEGLIIIDGDNPALKKLFIPVIEADLFDHSTKEKVDATNSALDSQGYKAQVHCREINFFYLDDGLRSRIEKTNNSYSVVDTTITFSTSELKELVESNPEKFSPNVILRPLYQETILPNLAYIGGPAEMVYWLQLKGVFDLHDIAFPILLPRNFALVMDAPTGRKFDKTKIALSDLFLEKDKLFNQAVLNFTQNNIQLLHEKECIEKHFEQILKNATSIDKTLGPLVGAETKRTIKSLEKIEHKLLKAEKRLQADRLQQIESVKDTLFPNGNLQERTDNFLNFYQTDPKFIDHLLTHFDPFDFQFFVMRYA
jgi:bacillithiol biosynthesis cysteine-adding enzyme BshC